MLLNGGGIEGAQSITFSCDPGITRTVPVSTSGSRTTKLIIHSRASSFQVSYGASIGAGISIFRIPGLLRQILKRLGRLRAKTGVRIGKQILVQRIAPRSQTGGSNELDHVLFDTPHLGSLENLGISLVKDGVIDRGILSGWPAPPDAPWRPRSNASPASIGVVVHLHYRDLWPEIEWFVRNIPVPFRLLVTLSAPEQGPDAALAARIRSYFPDAVVKTCENRGRDVGPFLSLLRDRSLDGCDLICKIHGKKSPNPEEATVRRIWRRRCLLDLLGHPSRIEEIISLLSGPGDVGMVGPGALLHPKPVDGPDTDANREHVCALLKARGIEMAPGDYQYFAGTMFWLRREALDLVRSLQLAAEDFPPEPAPKDGSLAHAAERLFGISTRHAGLKLVGLPELGTALALGGRAAEP